MLYAIAYYGWYVITNPFGRNALMSLYTMFKFRNEIFFVTGTVAPLLIKWK